MDEQQKDFLQLINLPLKRSPGLYILVLGLHLIALLSIVYFEITLPKYPFYLFIIISSIHHSWCQYFHQMPLNGKLLQLSSQDNWILITVQGDSLPLTPCNNNFVHPAVCILGFKYGWHRLYFMFFSDNTDEQALRKLRVRLRYPVRTPGNP